MNNIDQISKYFSHHPKFPFLNWDNSYDEYCAMFLCLTQLIKSYIPEHQKSDWSYADGYIDLRRNHKDPILSFPLRIINPKLRLVIHLGCISIDPDITPSYFLAQVAKNDIWGGCWENNTPKDEWYTEIAITIDLNNQESLFKTDYFFKLIFSEEHTYNDLKEFEDTTSNFFELSDHLTQLKALLSQ